MNRQKINWQKLKKIVLYTKLIRLLTTVRISYQMFSFYASNYVCWRIRRGTVHLEFVHFTLLKYFWTLWPCREFDHLTVLKKSEIHYAYCYRSIRLGFSRTTGVLLVEITVRVKLWCWLVRTRNILKLYVYITKKKNEILTVKNCSFKKKCDHLCVDLNKKPVKHVFRDFTWQKSFRQKSSLVLTLNHQTHTQSVFPICWVQFCIK